MNGLITLLCVEHTSLLKQGVRLYGALLLARACDAYHLSVEGAESQLAVQREWLTTRACPS